MDRWNIELANISNFVICKENDYPNVLFKYMNCEEFYPGRSFEKMTGGDGRTEAFRFHLHNFIGSFKPERVLEGKPYIIVTDVQGRFVLINENTGNEMKRPIGELKAAFQFICFINIVRFWQEFEQMRNMNVKLCPLIVKDLNNRIIDPNVVSELIDRAKKLEREIIYEEN